MLVSVGLSLFSNGGVAFAFSATSPALSLALDNDPAPAPAPPLGLTEQLAGLKQQLATLPLAENELQEQQIALFSQPADCCPHLEDQEQWQRDRAALEQSLADLNSLKTNLKGSIRLTAMQLQGFQVAEKVRLATDRADYKDDFYDRPGYGVLSDCTWYAAEALKLASAGHINLNQRGSEFGNWGNAGNWARGAAAYLARNPQGLVTGIDKVPLAGDVIVWTSGHVAFVEQVAEVRDEDNKLVRYIITISEEAVTGVGRYKDSVSVQLDDPSGRVRRWRSTLYYKAGVGNALEGDVQFIHFNYDPAWFN